MFIDYSKISVRSGNGGKGLVSFRREKFVPKGGPDGGTGGDGGNIVFRANPHLNTLLDFRYRQHFEAQNGAPGGNSNKTGKRGKNLVIQVPRGTVIKDAVTHKILADITEANQEVVLVKGGKGGLGNAEFTTPTNQAPRHAQPGKPGVEKNLILELKLLADVGLVGFPNAGKSTLISSISAARPKIGDYPFTTLVPNIGMVRMGEQMNFAVADIPGLIEGAHEGRGLGMNFLRHVERTRVLVFLLDVNSSDPAAEYRILREELRLFNPDMENRRRIICFSKADTIDQELKDDFLKTDFGEPETPVFMMSAVSGEEIERLKWAMWNTLQEAQNDEIHYRDEFFTEEIEESDEEFEDYDDEELEDYDDEESDEE